MFRAGLISLVILMVAGCVTTEVPSSTAFRSFATSQNSLYTSGKIKESEHYRRLHVEFLKIDPNWVAQNRFQHNSEYYRQRAQIAEAYEANRLTAAKYFELKQGLISWKTSMDFASRTQAIRERREADRRWDNFMSAMQGLQNELDRPRREQNEFNRNLPLPTMPSTNYSAPPIDGCLNGTQWMMDSAGRWECQ